MKKAKIVLRTDNAKIPTRGSEYSAGYDLYACLEQDEIEIKPHTTYKVPTGISVQCPKGHFGAIFARSGLASKQGLRPANCVGVVDEDFTGEIMVMLHNDTDEVQKIANGNRVAQLVFIKYSAVKWIQVETLNNTERGNGGFGSTGK